MSDTDVKLDINLNYIEQTIPGTMKMITTLDNTLQTGDLVKVVFGNEYYYLIVKSIGSENMVLSDLLLYNIENYYNVSDLQSLLVEMNKYALFPLKSNITTSVNFELRKGILMDILIQCCSNGVYLTMLDGSLKIMEIDEIYPRPDIEIVLNSWSIC